MMHFSIEKDSFQFCIRLIKIIRTYKWIVPDKLAHLVGDYQSDSDNEDSERTHRTSNDTATGKKLE